MARNSFSSALDDLLHPFRSRARRAQRERQQRTARERVGRMAEGRTYRELWKLTNQGCYYVFSDLLTLHAGNIDHLVIGPEGLTLVETKANSGAIRAHPAPRGKISLTVGGKALHRNLINQIHSQMWDLCERTGMKTGPDKTRGMNWIVCFPAGRLGQGLPPSVRVHVATTEDLLMKVRAGEHRADEAMVHAMASAVSSLYEKPPSAGPARRTPHTDQPGREDSP